MLVNVLWKKYMWYDLLSISLQSVLFILFDVEINMLNDYYKDWIMLKVSALLSSTIFTSPCSLWLRKCCLSSPHLMGWFS